MSNLSAASVAGLILTLLGFIVGIVAMATDHWADVARYQNGIYSGPKIEGHRGLIKYCEAGSCTTYVSLDGKVEDYISGALAAMCLAFLSNGAALVTMILWVVKFGSESTTKILRIVTILLLGIAIFWYFIAMVVFAAEDEGSRYADLGEDYTLSWSWGIVILAAVLDIFGIVMVVIAARKVT